MNWIKASILLILLPLVSLAQQPVKVDHPPRFVEETRGFADYVWLFPKKTINVLKDTSFTINVTMRVDTNGIGKVTNIKPKVDSAVYNEFVRIANCAPNWTPALIKYQPVEADRAFVFDVKLNKVKSQINIEPHRNSPSVTTNDEKVFYTVEKLADFPGGQKAYAEFLKANIRYPEQAKQKHIQGLVLVEVLIERDGSFTAMKVVHDPGDGLGQEAMRVLKLSPKWSPYWTSEYAARVVDYIPVKFSL